MPDVLIEAYVTSAEQAVAAEGAGAGRIELCGLAEGGVTPSLAAVAETVRAVGVPVHVMVRPRTGDFVYTAEEFAAMRASIAEIARSGAAGVVFGILHDDATLDAARMGELVAAARPLRVGCHRAFDATPDPDAALDALLGLGVDLVLTSGHAPTALAGAATLRRHVERAAGRIVVLAGGGVRRANVGAVVAQSGVREVHARGEDPRVIAEIAAALATAAKSP